MKEFVLSTCVSYIRLESISIDPLSTQAKSSGRKNIKTSSIKIPIEADPRHPKLLIAKVWKVLSYPKFHILSKKVINIPVNPCVGKV